MSLTQHTVRAAKWYAFFSISEQVLSLATTVVLARILAPGDFGLMAIALAITGVARVSQDLGLSSTLVQRKELDTEHINTVFLSMTLLGALLYTFFCLSARAFGSFYNDFQLAYLIMGCSLCFVFGPFTLVCQRILERKMDFKNLGIVSFCNTFLACIISIYMVLTGWGLWSLLVRAVFPYVSTPFIIWRFVEWRPRFQFSIKEFRESFDFGFKLSIAKAINHLRTNGIYLIVGKLLGPYTLGIYRLGHRTVTQPLFSISGLFFRTLFSSYSKVQDDNARLNRGYFMTLHYLGLIIIPIATFIMVSAPEIIRVVFGEKWIYAIPITQMICIMAIIEIFIILDNTVCYAKGRPDIFLKWNMLALPAYVIIIIATARFGIKGIVLSLTLASIPLFAILQIFINNLTGVTWGEFLRNLKKPLIISAVTAVMVYSFRLGLLRLPLNITGVLICEISTALLSYIFLSCFLSRDSIIQAYRMILNRYE